MPLVRQPVTDEDSRFFWDGVRDGRLLLQRCSGCSALRHPPGPMCPECLSLEWEAVEASGRGTVYAWVLSHHPTEPDGDPRVVVLVDLEEGVRLVSNLQDLPWTEVRNDIPVEIFFDDVDGVRLPQFRPRA
ncbi:MAG TPA: OB-fold domain-containing protein [Acidimicrobiales bacterium]|nr:OB-fold domain-containing protein [Acidimicrobiales bacterium]